MDLSAPDARSFIPNPFAVQRSRITRSGPEIRPFPASRPEPDCQPAPLPGVALACKPRRPGQHPILARGRAGGRASPRRTVLIPKNEGGNGLDLPGTKSCAIALRVQVAGKARAIQARDGGPVPDRPLQLPSLQPSDLRNALRAAGSASYKGDGVANAGLLALPRDEGSDRNVVGMAADAQDPEAAATETAQPPPLQAQHVLRPGVGLGPADPGPKLVEGIPVGQLRGPFRGRPRRPEPARRGRGRGSRAAPLRQH